MKYHAGASTPQQIDAIRDWLNDVVCPLFTFRIPDNEDLHSLRQTQPKAHSRYFPLKDNLPVIISEDTVRDYFAPSVVVMPKSVSRGYRKAVLGVHMLFTIWSPGEGGKFDHEGWRGIMNMLDTTARLLAQQVNIGIMTLELNAQEKTMGYGLVNEEEAAPDMRPYYMGYLMAEFSYPIGAVQTYGEKETPTTVQPMGIVGGTKREQLLK